MAKKYIDADLLRKKIEYLKAVHIGHAAITKETNAVDGFDAVLQVIDSLQQQTDGILNSYIEQRCKELDAIIQEEITPDNTVTIADKIGAMTAKNELLRIKELI